MMMLISLLIELDESLFSHSKFLSTTIKGGDSRLWLQRFLSFDSINRFFDPDARVGPGAIAADVCAAIVTQLGHYTERYALNTKGGDDFGNH